MKLRLAPTSRRLQWPWWAWAPVIAWAGIVAVVTYLNAGLSHPISLCMFKRLAGAPCPTCGLTRGGIRMMHGDVAGAWGRDARTRLQGMLYRRV